MEKIILLIDYKSSFGSKFNSNPPYSGLDLKVFSVEMKKNGYDIHPIHFHNIDFSKPNQYNGIKVLYQSSEANDGYGEYKSFIDDVLYFLKLSGAHLIPDYKYFKAHTNKAFMEMLRGFLKDTNKPNTKIYGSFQDFNIDNHEQNFPVIIKKSHGAQSLGVFKATQPLMLKRIVKKVSKASYSVKEILREKARKKKYGNSYAPFSINRNKFIVQSFTPGLTGDYKVLIFHDIFFIVKRDNPPNDFRASGGGYNSFLGEFNVPEGLLNYAHDIYKQFNSPYISLDIGVNGNGFNLIEFQFINFGTSGHSKSKKCIQKINRKFEVQENIYSIEFLYSYSIDAYLKK